MHIKRVNLKRNQHVRNTYKFNKKVREYGEGCSKPDQSEERISKTIQIIKEKAPKWMPLFFHEKHRVVT